MSSESYIRANFQSFNVVGFLQAFGLDDLDSAKTLFSTAIDHLSQGKPSPVSRWARDIKKSKYSIISSTTALDYYIQQTKKRALQLQELQILSDRLQDTSARARVTDGLGEIEDRSTQRENIIAARDQRDCDDVIEDSNEDDQTDTYVKRLKYEFQQTFDAMSNQQKWKLTTDKVVEDAMYTFGMKCTEEHLVHSFVLDTADPTYLDHNVFTEQELQEIKTCDKKPLVRLPDDLREYINSFSENDCGKLRQKVDTSWPWQADYDLSKNGDYDWVRNTVYGLVREYEADNFSHDHLEGWYSVHVWRLFDTVFDILENVDVSRGEPPSKASAERKNCKRKLGALVPMKRKKIGHRCDSIIQRLTANHEPTDEFGASEIAKNHDKFSTKVLYEHGHKLPKTLRDMFNALCLSYPSIVRRLETVGYIHQGLSCRLLCLDSPAGYVARITHIPEEEYWLTLAAKVDRFKEQTLPVILLAWQAKEIVSRVLNAIADAEEGHASDSSWLNNVFAIKPTVVMPHCSTSMETQSRKKKTVNN